MTEPALPPTTRIAFIGGGNMASAIIGGLLGRGLPAARIQVVEPFEAARAALRQQHGIDARPAADAALAGADLLVLECVPSALAREVSGTLAIPVIGIGAGPSCDGQVLVLYDALGITPGRVPRFARNFLTDGRDVRGALTAYVEAVKSGTFPGPEHELA